MRFQVLNTILATESKGRRWLGHSPGYTISRFCMLILTHVLFQGDRNTHFDEEAVTSVAKVNLSISEIQSHAL